VLRRTLGPETEEATGDCRNEKSINRFWFENLRVRYHLGHGLAYPGFEDTIKIDVREILCSDMDLFTWLRMCP
jgi:hypothetical protein